MVFDVGMAVRNEGDGEGGTDVDVGSERGREVGMLRSWELVVTARLALSFLIHLVLVNVASCAF